MSYVNETRFLFEAWLTRKNFITHYCDEIAGIIIIKLKFV